MSEPFAAELIVESFLSGKRIDTFLQRHFRSYSTFRLQRIVRAGEVRINDVPADNDSRVYRGQRVAVRLIEPPDMLLPPVASPLDILHEDPWLMVVVKPAGQIVHPAGDYATNSLATARQHHLDQQTQRPGLLRPGIVHRLDRMTSGVVVVAKEHLAHALLAEAFMRRKVRKTYLALLEGILSSDHGALDKPIGLVADVASVLMSAAPDARDPRCARTEFQVVERFAKHTLVEARPITGRQHQIRIHFAEIGHPVVDDEFYGPFGWIKKAPDGSPIAKPGVKGQGSEVGDQAFELNDDEEPAGAKASEISLVGRHALHAFRLEFRHPITWQSLVFEAPLPADMSDVIERLRSGRWP